MHARLRFLSLTALASLALCAASCVSAPSDAPAVEGELAIPLSTTAPDGTVYRLSSATFEISGPGGLTLLDGNVAAPSVSAELPPGLVNVFLRPNWVLSRSTDGGATFTPVDALLGSVNPLAYRVLADTATTLSFNFLVRNPSGTLAVSFGVDPTPRQLAGGIRVTAASMPTGRLADYANTSFDFSAYFTLSTLGRRTELDGSKTLIYTSGATAVEFYNDPFGLFTDELAPAYAGGYLEYQITAKTDGTQELSGTLYGASYPYPELVFAPTTMRFSQPLDAQGFPTDAYFHEVPAYTLTLFDDENSTGGGSLVVRNLLPGADTP